MAKDEQSNQLNLTVIALVALVAIVGLVALVMNAASITKVPQLATGSQVVSAETVSVYDDQGNLVGEALRPSLVKSDDYCGGYVRNSDGEWGRWCWEGDNLKWDRSQIRARDTVQ